MVLPSFGSSVAVLSLFFLLLQKTQSVLLADLVKSRLTEPYDGPAMSQPNGTSSCALFMGNWVRDETYPLYESASCPAIEPKFNCQKFGRPDSDYLKYRWKPADCELPRFNGLDFLLRMRGKTVMFVGDSLGRNQWESLICMISAAVPRSRAQMARGYPLSTCKFLDYGVTVSFYAARFLVDVDVVQGKRVLKLDDVSGNGKEWQGADVLSFNTGHWWSHTGSLQGWDYLEWGGSYYPDMDRLTAFERGMGTWAKWVDDNIDHSRTRIFFLSISPTHYDPTDWNAGASTKNCYGETVPTSGSAYPGPPAVGTYPDQMRVVEATISGMRNPPYLLDITALSAMRKDAHPSIYSGDISPNQRANPERSADCSHWCLPGLPDTWNQLLYAALF
ncbi:hypothetical protein NMG60_11014475 [Bertholletia excelsa]